MRDQVDLERAQPARAAVERAPHAAAAAAAAPAAPTPATPTTAVVRGHLQQRRRALYLAGDLEPAVDGGNGLPWRVAEDRLAQPLKVPVVLELIVPHRAHALPAVQLDQDSHRRWHVVVSGPEEVLGPECLGAAHQQLCRPH